MIVPDRTFSQVPDDAPLRQVSATDPDCGVNAQVNYSIGTGFRKMDSFSIQADSGDICISAPLDHERRAIYEFPVVAMDRGECKRC